MKMTTVTMHCGVVYRVPDCLLYWLGFEVVLKQINHVFALLADHVAPSHRVELWANARAEYHRQQTANRKRNQ